MSQPLEFTGIIIQERWNLIPSHIHQMHYYALVDSLAIIMRTTSLPQSQDRHSELLTAHGETQQLIQAIFMKQRKILQLIKDSRKNEKRQNGSPCVDTLVYQLKELDSPLHDIDIINTLMRGIGDKYSPSLFSLKPFLPIPIVLTASPFPMLFSVLSARRNNIRQLFLMTFLHISLMSTWRTQQLTHTFISTVAKKVIFAMNVMSHLVNFIIKRSVSKARMDLWQRQRLGWHKLERVNPVILWRFPSFNLFFISWLDWEGVLEDQSPPCIYICWFCIFYTLVPTSILAITHIC